MRILPSSQSPRPERRGISRKLDDTVTLSLYSKLIASEELEIVPIESSEIFLETFEDSIPSCAIIDLGVIYKDGTIHVQ